MASMLLQNKEFFCCYNLEIANEHHFQPQSPPF